MEQFGSPSKSMTFRAFGLLDICLMGISGFSIYSVVQYSTVGISERLLQKSYAGTYVEALTERR